MIHSLVEDGALRIVVVGGGPTGVESVGALAELYHSDFAKDYPRLPAEHAKLTIVEAGDDLFSMFDRNSAATRRRRLKSAGSRSCSARSSRVEPTRVTLKSGRFSTPTPSSGAPGSRPTPSPSPSGSSSSTATGSRSVPT